MRLWYSYYDTFLKQDASHAIWPLSPEEKIMIARAMFDVRTEIDRLQELEPLRAQYLAVAAIDRLDDDLIALAALEESRAQPSWPSYTEVSDEPDCSGNNPLTMLNWMVEDGGGALGAC
jgi:hypothetical protein